MRKKKEKKTGSLDLFSSFKVPSDITYPSKLNGYEIPRIFEFVFGVTFKLIGTSEVEIEAKTSEIRRFPFDSILGTLTVHIFEDKF